MASLQGSLVKPVPEYQTVPDSAAARGDGGDSWNSLRRAKLQSDHHHPHANSPTLKFLYRSDALPLTQLTVSKHCL